MPIDLEALAKLREERIAQIKLQEQGFASFDISDGRHAAEIVDVGTRATSIKKIPQIFIRWKIVSDTRDKGHRPYQTFNIPRAEDLQRAQEMRDEDEINRLLVGFNIFNQAFTYITGQPGFTTIGTLAQGLQSGVVRATLLGRRAEIEASHNGEFLSLRVRRALGTSPSKIAKPIEEPTPVRRKVKTPPRKRKK